MTASTERTRRTRRTRYSRVLGPLTLLLTASISLLVAGQVDEEIAVRLGGGTSLSQGWLLRGLALLQLASGLWLAIRVNSSSLVLSGLAALSGLGTLRLLRDPASVEMGNIALDARVLIGMLEFVALAAILVLAASRAARRIKDLRRPRRAGSAPPGQ